MTIPVYARSPGAVLAAVEVGLRDLGLSRLYLSDCSLVGVLSVAYGVTAWCDGYSLHWTHGGAVIRWPIADAQGAAEQLAELARNAGEACS